MRLAQEMDALPPGTTSEESGGKLRNLQVMVRKVKEEKELKVMEGNQF